MSDRQARRVTAEEAAALVQSGNWLDYGLIINQPDAFDRALAARIGELRNVSIRNCLSMRPRQVIEADPDGTHAHLFNWHFSGYDRKKHDQGRCTYIPCNLGEITDYYRRFIDRVDIAITKVCPPDAEGCFNLGPTSLWQRAILARARIVIVEVTPTLPPAFGSDNRLHPSEVDYVIEGDDTPTPVLPPSEPTEVDIAVGRLIAAEIEDGACLQVGIGGMPSAVTNVLLRSGVQNLGVHTEMLNDGILDLYLAGRVTGSAKALDPGKVVYTFAVGCRILYETVRDNPDFLLHPVERTNMPDIIARNPKAVAINNTTMIDLQGQASSESDGHRHISGTGGQLQFVRGAYASEGGKSFICLASTYERKGVRKSRIALNLTPAISSPRRGRTRCTWSRNTGSPTSRGSRSPSARRPSSPWPIPTTARGWSARRASLGLIPKFCW